MKATNHTLIIYCLLILVFANACKKGQDDPSISLKSRRARVAGEWKVQLKETNAKSSGTNTTLSSNTTPTITNIESSSVERWNDTEYYYSNILPNGNHKTTNDTTIQGKVSIHTIKFEKDGEWKNQLDYTLTYPSKDNNGNDITVKQNTIIKQSGVWNFLGKIQPDTKDKEEIMVTVRTESVNVITYKTYASSTIPYETVTDTQQNTYQDAENSAVWKLTRLASAEIKATIIKQPVTTHSTKTETVNGSATTVINQLTTQVNTSIQLLQ